MFSCFTSYRGAFVLAAAVIVGGYLAVWHGTHIAAALPFLVVLSCPLIHMLMHGGHNHHPGTDTNADPRSTSSSSLSRQSRHKGE